MVDGDAQWLDQLRQTLGLNWRLWLQAVLAWRDGQDTHDIARRLKTQEPQIYNKLPFVRDLLKNVPTDRLRRIAYGPA